MVQYPESGTCLFSTFGCSVLVVFCVVGVQESDGAVSLGQGPAGSVHLGALFLLYFVLLFCRS